MNLLFTLYVWLVWTLMLLVWGPLAVLTVLAWPRLGFRVVQGGSRLALGLAGIRVRVLGRERVDWTRAHVFMGNHQGLLDPFVLVMAIPGHMVGIEKQENFRIPIYGQLARAWGNLPIDRSNPEAALATIAEAEQRLAAGTSIAIFPEGTRTTTGAIGPFKKGGFHLAINTGAAIVPFTISGCFERLPIGTGRVRPGEVTIEFGEAIPTAGVTREAMAGLMGRVRTAIAARYPGVALPK